MPTSPATPITITTRFEEDEAGTLRHVPFELPTRVQRFRLTVSYNDQIDSSPTVGGGNTLDIGLFDPQGIESGGEGFRGWSGSNKLEIVIGAKWSTPPYRPGKPQAGTWHLLLGAYKVGPNGLDVTATIELNPSFDNPPEPKTPVLADLVRAVVPAAAVKDWYRGDIHCHTIYSDGSATPVELAVAAYEAGLDFYGITDHNRAQSPVGMVPTGAGWPLLVPGVEITTYAGHFNAWGTDTWYDFRDPTESGLQAAVDAARADGALVSMNHPKPFGPDWVYRDVTGFDCIEPWNGWWERINDVSLKVWDDALRRGERLTGVCGSDVHHPGHPNSPDNPLSPARIGWPTLWVNVEGTLTVKRILDAIRAGRCFMSDSPSGPQVYLEHDRDHVTARVVHGAGTVLTLVTTHGLASSELISSDDESWTYAYSVLGSKLKYIRAQIHGQHGGIRALTNPAWLG
ncbi:MAG TPA: CehA/McbA family metallohydrolase [Thermomicrobiales bacterium]|nr:CehA/McbA family metallohydrolase [Thermomicrobiales bacterium]